MIFWFTDVSLYIHVCRHLAAIVKKAAECHLFASILFDMSYRCLIYKFDISVSYL